MYNILCSLNFLETANVIHRDLKPGNILITDKCGIQICDFGFARTLPEGFVSKSEQSLSDKSTESNSPQHSKEEVSLEE